MTTFPHYITTLDYLPLANLFVPSEVPSKKLTIILHGRGGKSEDFCWIPESFDFDDMHYLLLDAPNTYEEGYSWFDGLESIQDISKQLRRTFDILFAKDFDASQSFLMGFSQGALLTFECGARYPQKMAGYIAISGNIYNPELLIKETPTKIKKANWLCTHGIKDKALDFSGTKKHIEILQKGGFNITFKIYDKAHSIIKEEIILIYQWIKNHSN